MSTETANTKIVTGPVRLSYAAVWEPQAMVGEPDGEKKYSAVLLIAKSDTKTLKAVNDAVAAAFEAGKAKVFKGTLPAKWRHPLRDGDGEDGKGDPNYAGHYFISAKSKTKPGIVDANVKPIFEQGEVYSGCYIRASINAFAYDTKGNKGVSFGLNNIMKIKDGESLAGRASADSDFAAFIGQDSEEEDF